MPVTPSRSSRPCAVVTTLLLATPPLVSAQQAAWAAATDGGRPPIATRIFSEYVSTSSLGGNGAEAGFYQVGLQAQVPFPISGDLSGSIGVGAENRGYDFRNLDRLYPGIQSPLGQVIATRVAPGLSYRIDDKWRLFAGASWLTSGGVGTSIRSATMWGGAGGVIYQWTPEFRLAVGVTGAQRLGEPFLLVPLLGFNWQIDPDWNLVGGNVADAINGPTLGIQLGRQLTERWSVFGLGGFVDTFTRFATDSTIPDGSLRNRAGSVHVGTECRLDDTFTVRFSAGARIFQQYTFRNASGNQLTSAGAATSAVVALSVRAAF
ncbi:MAG: DUF6268 family outer membrane beta-barrel protein [Verrucomicrobiota bacterium]